MRPSPSIPATFLTLASSCLLLIAGFLLYGSTGHDDSHINFWNVHTLLAHGELVNYNGERVQQTTSLLQDLLTAGLVSLLDWPLVTAGYLVDIAAALGCCWLGMRLAWQLCPALSHWIAWLTLSSSSFLLWTFGGMGAPLASLCLLSAVWCWWQWLVTPQLQWCHWLALLLSTLAMTLVRPEMPVVATAITAALVVISIRQPGIRERSLLLLAASLIATAGLFFWQHSYFGSWLPIPAVAKQGGDFWPQLQRGTFYLLLGGTMNPVLPLALLASVATAWAVFRQWLAATLTPQHYFLAILLCSLWAYTGFVWTAGGDWMQAARFLVPVIVPAGLVLLHWLSQWRAVFITHGLLAALVLGQCALQYPIITRTSHGIPLWVNTRITPEHAARYGIFERLNQEHVRDMAIIDHLADIIPVLHQQLQRPVQLISGQAGMVFYYTAQRFYGHVQFRDLRGLVESSLTLCPLLRDVPRSPQGLFWGYSEFFAQLPLLQQQCNIVQPDIIYDLNDMNQKLGKTLEPMGYTMIHQESGFMVENHTALPYNRLLAPNMIFLRNDLLPLLGHPPKRILNYQTLPLTARWPLSSID